MAEQAAMEPKQTSTFSKPFCFRIEAAMIARCPLPQKVVIDRSIASRRAGTSPI
jgi:hypothetical protein